MTNPDPAYAGEKRSRGQIHGPRTDHSRLDFLILGWGVIIALTVYCFSRVCS
jgi:hypothetical protein